MRTRATAHARTHRKHVRRPRGMINGLLVLSAIARGRECMAVQVPGFMRRVSAECACVCHTATHTQCEPKIGTVCRRV